MSADGIKSFIERIRTDEVFANKVAACKDVQDRVAFAKAAGFDFTPDQFAAMLGELTDKELKCVVGGYINRSNDRENSTIEKFHHP